MSSEKMFACKSCGVSISKKAVSCPHCGHGYRTIFQQRMARNMAIFAGIWIFMLLAVFIYALFK